MDIPPSTLKWQKNRQKTGEKIYKKICRNDEEKGKKLQNKNERKKNWKMVKFDIKTGKN